MSQNILTPTEAYLKYTDDINQHLELWRNSASDPDFSMQEWRLGMAELRHLRSLASQAIDQSNRLYSIEADQSE